jgi:uncharacterized protein
MQHDWLHPLRGDWITRLEDHLLLIKEQTIQYIPGRDAEMAAQTFTKAETEASTDINAQTGLQAPSIVLIAHSLGCHLIAAWAALSKNTHRVRGALLVAPPDCVREQFPQELKSWRAPVLQKLPFPSICVISSNDPFCDLQPGRDMAAAWGSERIELGDKGHINADSGLGDWPQGRALVARLMA